MSNDLWDDEYYRNRDLREKPEPEPCSPQGDSMPAIPDGLADDWTSWDAWWNDDSLLFVDWPDPEPEFDYSYRRPGWPRLS